MGPLKYLNKYLVKYKYRLILGTFFVVVSNIFGILLPMLVKEAFDTISYSDKFENPLQKPKIERSKLFIEEYISEYISDMDLTKAILFLVLMILLMSLAKGIFTFLMRQTIIIVSRLIEFDLKNEIYKHYQELSMSFYKKNNTGDIMNRISEDVTRVRMYLGPGIMYSINVSALFLLTIPVMLSIDVELTIYALAPLPILSILIYYVSNRINKKSEVVQAQLSNLSTFSQESFSGIRIIKSYVKEKYMNNSLEKEAEDYKDKNLDLVKLESFFFPIMMMLIGLSTILTIYIGGIKTINGDITIGNIAQFIIFVNMLTWPVTAIGWVTSIIQRASASQRRINEFLNTKSDIVNKNLAVEDIKGKIEFKNVTFTYPESGTVALKKINFAIEAGKTLAIVGRTGSGKSTIADLVCRIFESSEGEILIDGKEVEKHNLNQLRANIGYVPQEVFLFSDSIKNNISFGLRQEEVSMDQIEDAAKKSAIHNNIIDFPNKYETLLGERGITLSGGQKQRISIARAIIAKPQILILDDCLSAVDTETEEIILKGLEEIMGSKTSIIISHRISSVKHADQILVLEDGNILEKGTHEELIDLNGRYSDMYSKQLLEEQKKSVA